MKVQHSEIPEHGGSSKNSKAGGGPSTKLIEKAGTFQKIRK